MKIWLAIKASCLIAVSVFLCIFLQDLHKLAGKATLTVENADRALIAVGAAAGNVEKASRQWQEASASQASATTQAMSRVSVAAGALSSFVSRTDNSVNSDLLPRVTLAIQQQNAALLTSQQDLQADLSQMAQATAQAQKLLSDAGTVIADPNIKQSLQYLTATTQNASQATAEAVGTMKDVRTAADYELKQLMAPVSKVKAGLEIAARVVGRFFGF